MVVCACVKERDVRACICECACVSTVQKRGVYSTSASLAVRTLSYPVLLMM